MHTREGKSSHLNGGDVNDGDTIKSLSVAIKNTDVSRSVRILRTHISLFPLPFSPSLARVLRIARCE